MEILNKKDIKRISEILLGCGVLAFPTETVFGLGVLANSVENYNKLVKVKNRRPDKPFTLMFSNIEQVNKYLEIDETSRKIITNCMPGPLTLILKAKKGIPECIDHGTGFVGIRMPDDKFVLEMINSVNDALFVPSCNKADQPPCKNAEEVSRIFSNEIEGVVCGDCVGGVPSTIIKVEKGRLLLIRQGELTIDQIEEKIK